MKKINNNFRVMLVVSCVIILMVPILISTLTGTKTLRELEKVNTANNELIVSQIQKDMDYAVDDVFKIKTELLTDQNVYALSAASGDDLKRYQYELSEVYNTLRKYRSTMTSIDVGFIYFPNIDTIVSTNGIFKTEEYYKNYYTVSERNIQQWRTTLETETNGFFVNGKIKTSGGPREELECYCSLRLLGQINPPMFCASIAQSYLDNILKSGNYGNPTYTLVVDEDNNYLLGNEKSIEVSRDWAKFVKFPQQTSGCFSAKLNERKVMVGYVEGKYSGWKYLSVMETADFWRQINLLRILTIGGILLSLILGYVGILAAVKYNYSPLEHIITLLDKAVPETTEGEKNAGEFRYIESSLTKMLEQKEAAVNQIEQHKKPLRDSFVVRLLSGNIAGLPSIEDALDNVDLRFDKEDFLVLKFYVEDYSALFYDEEEVTDEQRISMTQFIISNVSDELFAEYSCHMVIMDGMPVMLLNLDYDGEEKNISDISHYIQEFLTSNFDLNVQIGISNVKKSYEGIAEAYDEASETVEYKMLMGKYDLLYYHEMPKTNESEFRYGFSIEYEQSLISAVQSGNLEKATEVLNRVFDNVSENTELSIVKCFMFDVGSTIIKTIEEIRPQWDEAGAQMLDHVQGLLKSNSLTAMRSGLTELLKEICGYFDKENKELKLSDRIYAYLLNNYSDVNLNVAAIGREFGMVPRYISKVFKDDTGEGLLDCINRIRIQEAKKIMQNKELVLEDIAGQVGFTNVNSFIRVFKKYEEMTPGKYREML